MRRAASRIVTLASVIPIVTPEEMAAVDAAAPEPVDVLIDRAGRAVARTARQMLGGAYGRVVTVVAGRGNNGADGRTAGAYLAQQGIRVHVVDAASRPDALPPSDLVIDAAFGTGYRPDDCDPWVAPDVPVLSNRGVPSQVLAVDIPSGVDALTGAAGPGVLPADRTVTFQAVKPGLLFAAGAGLAGDVEVVDIGLDVSGAGQHLVEADDVATWWAARGVHAHKWHGAVRVIAGSAGMAGAGRLCAAGAARAGAGLVSLSSPGTRPGARDEVIQHDVAEADFATEVVEELDRFGALVIGPGLGRHDDIVSSVRAVIADAAVPVVIDGDGLFATAWSAAGAAPLLRSRGLPTVLTPHDGEYALLTGDPPGDDRVTAARSLAADTQCTVLLKGPTTVVSSPGGDVLVVDRGDQRLATAGSGDVLAGMVGAALAAGVPPLRAAAAAAWLHADAARRGPPEGLLAGDIIELLPAALAALR